MEAVTGEDPVPRVPKLGHQLGQERTRGTATTQHVTRVLVPQKHPGRGQNRALGPRAHNALVGQVPDAQVHQRLEAAEAVSLECKGRHLPAPASQHHVKDALQVELCHVGDLRSVFLSLHGQEHPGHGAGEHGVGLLLPSGHQPVQVPHQVAQRRQHREPAILHRKLDKRAVVVAGRPKSAAVAAFDLLAALDLLAGPPANPVHLL